MGKAIFTLLENDDLFDPAADRRMLGAE